MKFTEMLKKRRSYYALNGEVSLSNEQIESLIGEVILNTPDAFHIQNARVVLLLDEESKKFWTKVNETYNNKINKEKFQGFYDAKGTVLYFINHEPIEKMKKDMPKYSERFDQWAHHANGMLQSNVWVALRQEEIGATLQHYNPGIDAWVRKDYNLPESWELIAQMPFGGIIAEPEAKEKLPVEQRMKIVK